MSIKRSHKKLKDLVKFQSFPDPLAPDSEKDTEEYGLTMGKAVEYEWFYRPDSGGCSYHDKRDRFHYLRLYARGEQSTNLYKDLLIGGEADSYSNYDWRPLQIIPKFVNLIVNQMSERLFDIKAESVDKYSTDLKDTQRENLENLMYARPAMEEAMKQLGIDLNPGGDEVAPETQEEVDLYMKLKYKPAIEIASEEAIRYTLEMNDYEHVQNRVIRDVTTIGIAAVKHSTDPVQGIKVEYVDPANMVYSYPVHENFKEVHYYGEVRRISIHELKRMFGDKYSDDDYRDVASSTSEWARYHGNTNDQYYYREDDLGNIMVDMLFFTFRSNRTINMKKKHYKNGGFGMQRKDSEFKKNNVDYKGFDVKKKIIDVWYEGMMVMGTNMIANYKLCENMIRPGGNLNKTIPNYIVYTPELYQNRYRSTVNTMITYVDIMQQIHIKIQQLIAKARPNGVYIDIAGLEDIETGEAGTLDYLEVMRIYNETGNVIGTSETVAGDYNHGRQPITELKNGVIEGLDRLISSYNHYLNLIRDAIGIPAGADASNPHPDTLVGVQQMVALNSNTATRHILQSGLNISERLGEALALRLKSIFQHKNLKDAYTQAIGKINMKTLKAIERYHLHDLGIIIKLKPDAEERSYLDKAIERGMAANQITVDDAFEIRGIGNTKLAMELLKIRRQKRERGEKDHQLKMIETQNQGQMQAAQVTSQTAMQEIQAKTQGTLLEIQAKTQGKLQELAAEEAAEGRLLDKKLQYELQLKGMDVQGQMGKAQLDNDEKRKRANEQNTATSKIQEQKQYNAPAIDFSSQSGSIAGRVGSGNISGTLK